MPHPRTNRRRAQPNKTAAQLLGLLLAITIVIAIVGAAAVVVVPASLVILVLVLAQPHGVGGRIRTWRLFQRAKGLEAHRRVVTFATVLTLYGIVAPSGCLALMVSVVRSSTSSTATVASTASTPGPVLATDTAAPSLSPAPRSGAAPPSEPATMAPAPSPPPVPRDPCHVARVTYCVLNPAVTQATITSTMCVSGWTKTVRPPESYTENLKRQQIAAEGLPGGLSAYEEDHRMPLELGGAPTDPMNLSPESPPSPNPKDSDETELKRDVCSGLLTLAQAQEQLAAKWLGPYPAYEE